MQYGVDSLGASEGSGATPEPLHFAHRWQYGWLPSSKIKDFKGAFGNIAKSRKSKFLCAFVSAFVCSFRCLFACVLSWVEIWEIS